MSTLPGSDDELELHSPPKNVKEDEKKRRDGLVTMILNSPKKLKEDGEKRRDVEVLYSDGTWYKGWLSSFNFNTGKGHVNGLSNFMTIMKLEEVSFRT